MVIAANPSAVVCLGLCKCSDTWLQFSACLQMLCSCGHCISMDMQQEVLDAPESEGFEIALGCPATALILGLMEKQQKGDPAALSQAGATGCHCWFCSLWA